MVGVVVLIGALLIFVRKQPLHFLLQASSSSDIHAPYAWLFLLGLLQAQWTYTGFDASAHVAEETLDPRQRAPWGMVMAVVISGLFGYMLILSFTLVIPSVSQVLSAKGADGSPLPAVLAIVQSGLGSRAVIAVLGLTVVAMWFCGLASLTSLAHDLCVRSRWGDAALKHMEPS